MKKFALIGTCAAAALYAMTIGIATRAFAQSSPAFTGEAAVNEMTTISNGLTVLQRIDAQRAAILVSIQGEVSAMATQAQTLASEPLVTKDERQTASGEIASLTGQVMTLSGVVTGLNQVLGGEVSLLTTMQLNLAELSAALKL